MPFRPVPFFMPVALALGGLTLLLVLALIASYAVLLWRMGSTVLEFSRYLSSSAKWHTHQSPILP